jgi:hypothetical protein
MKKLELQHSSYAKTNKEVVDSPLVPETTKRICQNEPKLVRDQGACRLHHSRLMLDEDVCRSPQAICYPLTKACRERVFEAENPHHRTRTKAIAVANIDSSWTKTCA